MNEKLKKYHFIGIGGIGMSALARILLEKQVRVSGSDISSGDHLKQLIQQGAEIYQGHAAHHISADDTVVFTSQIQKNNPEYQAALQLKCPMLHRSELLAQLMGGYQTLAVAGTHGKTTTTSLLTTVLMAAGYDPTFAVGGMVGGVNGKYGKGNFFVAEADESDGTFLNYHPQGAIITNVEAEHLDHYKTVEALHQAFRTFLSHVKNPHLLFYCGDDPVLTALADGKGIAYGFEGNHALRICNYRQVEWNTFFDVHFGNEIYNDVKVALVGKHNALNAAAVFGLCLTLGVAEADIRKGLAHFPGVGRRCEKKADMHSVLMLDDYAHHPTEIRATLLAVKKAVQNRRLVAVFQPHRYTRTKDLWKEFCTAFELADFLYVTDIYSAFENPLEGIDAEMLVKDIRKVSTIPCAYLPKNMWCEELRNSLRPHDVLLTLGAGDITRLHADLMSHFFSKKFTVGLIFGGSSCEHEISVRSARFAAASLNRDLYDVRFFGIDKEGQWITGDEAELILQNQPVVVSSHARPLLDPAVTHAIAECEIFLPILHGTYGEDGTVQGFFEMLGKPYAGPDYRSAAICMDKVLTKRLVELNGVKTPKDLSFGYLEWMQEREDLLRQILEILPLPVYVKPVHLGSSVGITCVSCPDRLGEAIDLAFKYDTYVMVEEGKINCREMEFAVMGNTHSFPVQAPAPGEKLACGGFVDYESKYGQNPIQTTIDPKMAPDVLEKGKALARKAYEAIGCTGMTRVDFLLDEHEEFWLFEMNPIPGLQKLSLFPKIWNREGVTAQQLFDRLIILALERHRKQKRHYQCLSL